MAGLCAFVSLSVSGSVAAPAHRCELMCVWMLAERAKEWDSFLEKSTTRNQMKGHCLTVVEEEEEDEENCGVMT